VGTRPETSNLDVLAHLNEEGADTLNHIFIRCWFDGLRREELNTIVSV